MFEFLIAAIPLLLLVISLLLGRYPGCETAMRLAARIARRRARVTGTDSRRGPRPSLRHAPHGGLLLAFGLSGRAPPA